MQRECATLQACVCVDRAWPVQCDVGMWTLKSKLPLLPEASEPYGRMENLADDD